MTLPAVPGHRMPLDLDGSAAFLYRAGGGGAVSVLTTAQMQALTNESTDSFSMPDSNDYIGWIFPETRDIVGLYVGVTAAIGSYTFSTSTNTTTGADGTWTTITPNPSIDVSGAITPDYRTLIQTFTTITGAKAIRTFQSSNPSVHSFHVYGQPSSGQNPDSLRVWDPIGGTEVSGSFLDFGDMQQSSAATKTFQIRNISTTKTAHSITLTLNVLTDTSPSLIGQFQLSTDNVTFANSINIGDLAPVTTSATLYVRDNVSATAGLSAQDLRMVATPTSWT